MKTTTHIITHEGPAHLDEFLSIAIIFACEKTNSCIISRRDPSEKELNDKNIWVVDVGMDYDPEKRNFDHHQYSGGLSSFPLVAKYFNINKIAENVFPWWNTLSNLDTQGPFSVAKNFNCDPNILLSMQSPIQHVILKQFENDVYITLPLLKELGSYILTQINIITERLKVLHEQARIFNIEGVNVIQHRIEESPTRAMDLFKKEFYPNAGISVTPDDRGDGLTLYRFGDDPRIDFSKLEGREEITFAHKTGFIAKTKDCYCSIEKLIKDSIVKI